MEQPGERLHDAVARLAQLRRADHLGRHRLEQAPVADLLGGDVLHGRAQALPRIVEGLRLLGDAGDLQQARLEHRDDEVVLGEAAEDRRVPHAGAARDLVHAEIGAALGEELDAAARIFSRLRAASERRVAALDTYAPVATGCSPAWIAATSRRRMNSAVIITPTIISPAPTANAIW